ncbi:MAG: hypothetical protein JO113_00450, partial [Candidatus Eremiobacteraeota bacterium]|nr:hypothetical protein [Candidatus Eremiobacteraeota bacterium]
MAHSLLRLKRTAVAAGAIIFIGITISSFGIVRAARYMPVNGITYTCSTGTACVEGNSTGKPWGAYGNSSGGNGVEGQSSASAHAGVAGVNLGTQGYGVYGESADLSGKYAALFGQGDANATNLLRVYNRATGASCIVDPYASLTCTGNVYGRGGGSENAVAGTNFDGGTGVFGNAYAGETGVLG